MKSSNLKLKLLDQNLILLPQKAIYWEDKKTLIASDLHLSKAGHFRKAGLPIPTDADEENYLILDNLIDAFNPEKLLVVGDLIHSSYNKELEQFCVWREKHCSLKIVLTQGNHDVLPENFYTDCKIEIVDFYQEPPFVFYHEPLENIQTTLYPISGHIHPGVTLSGKARQSIQLPCFYFGSKQALLPAFGSLTGHVRVPVREGDQVFVILENTVCKVS